MKTLLVVAVISIAAGCGGSSNAPADMAVPGDLAVSMDLAVPDLAGQTCTMLGAWPNLQPEGSFDGTGPVTIALSRQAGGTPFNSLSVEAWHSETYPNTTTYKKGDTYELCDTCVFYNEDCDGQTCSASFFAQAGSATVTQADANDSMGAMKASAMNLRLFEWDFANDRALPGGRCVEVTSATWDVIWMNLDGGMTD